MARLVRGLALGAFVSVLAVVLVTQPVSAARDDTATVCKNTAATVNTGLQQFVAQMQQVSQQASAGDLTGAEATVKQGGATLQGVSTQLTQQSAAADDPKVKQAVTDLATELNTLSGQLTTLTGLQNFDTTRLVQLAQNMSQLCGPSASFPAPSGSAAPPAAPSSAPSSSPSVEPTQTG